MKKGKDNFNIVEPTLYGSFRTSLIPNGHFFVNDKYSGLYPSALFDIILGNKPTFGKLIRRLC